VFFPTDIDCILFFFFSTGMFLDTTSLLSPRFVEWAGDPFFPEKIDPLFSQSRPLFPPPVDLSPLREKLLRIPSSSQRPLLMMMSSLSCIDLALFGDGTLFLRTKERRFRRFRIPPPYHLYFPSPLRDSVPRPFTNRQNRIVSYQSDKL